MTLAEALIRDHLHHLTAVADELCGAIGPDRAFDALVEAAQEAAPAIKATGADVQDPLLGIDFAIDLHTHGTLTKAGVMEKVRGLLGIEPADPALA